MYQSMGSRGDVAMVQKNGKWVMVRPGKHVMVIVPGAGTGGNNKSYAHLSNHFDVRYANTQTSQGGYKYPDGWENINDVPLQKDPNDSLMGLVRQLGKEVVADPPALIICGSRGGQVVLPQLLQHFWRGAFVCINAGPLTSQAKLPEGCKPFFITCGQDFFKTRDPQFVERKFRILSSVYGKNLFLQNQGHMPKLSNDTLTQIANHMLEATTIRFHLQLLSPDPAPVAPHPAPVHQYYTVQSDKASHVLLRKKPESKNNWYTDNRKFVNGTKVLIQRDDVDENGYAMFYATNGAVSGWLYAMNIKELK